MDNLIKKLFLILFFIAFGLSSEVVFTAIKSIVRSLKFHEPIDWEFRGYSNLWMIILYTLVPILLPLLYKIMVNFNILIRGLTYGIGIFALQFIYGFVIKTFTGIIPWDFGYAKLNIEGLIRLDYAPLWIIYSLMCEQLYNYLRIRLR